MSVNYNPYNYFKDKTLIDGNYGPYNKNTPVGRSANAGLNAAQYSGYAILNNDGDSFQKKSIQYTTVDTETGKLSVNGALAYAANSMAMFLKPKEIPNGQSKVRISKKDDDIIKIAASLDGDPTTLNVAENATLTMFEDSATSLDGIVTPEDVKIASDLAKEDPTYTKENLTGIYTENDLENKAKKLKMPEINDSLNS